MADVTIWHNPRCSKSRAAMAFLEERGIEPHVVRYLETPPDEAELRRVLGLLGMKPRELMRTKEARYKELGLADVTDDDALIRAMVENPILIERPVVIQGDKAVVARPTEAIAEIL